LSWKKIKSRAMEMETIKSRAGDVGRKEKKSGNGVIIK
jgi:hypothetical protein